MMQKAGLKMPPADGNWTYDDLMALAKGLTQSQGGRTTVYGILPAISDTTINEGMVGMLRAFGGSVFDADGKQCLLNSDESKAALKVFSELWTSGVGFPWQPDISEQTPELFQSGKWPWSSRPASPRRPGRARSPSGPIRSTWTSFRIRSVRATSTRPRSRRTARASPLPARCRTRPGSC